MIITALQRPGARAALACAFVSLLFWVLIEILQHRIGVAVWEHSLILTLGYAAPFCAALLVATRGLRDWQSLSAAFLVGLATAVGAALLTGLSTIAAVILAITLQAIVWGTFRLLLDGPATGWRRIAVGIFASCTVTTVLCATWVATTAPAYAEGFVVLAVLLFALLNLLLAVAIGTSGKSTGTGNSRLRGARVLGLLATCLIIAGATLFYLIWSEGDTRPALNRMMDRSEAFQPPSGDRRPPPARRSIAPIYDRERIIAALLRPAHKNLAQLGNLALLTGEPRWRNAFHDAILDEARGEAFSGPTGSVKFGQHYAMLRGILLLEIRERFPDLFSPDEQQLLRKWFDAVVTRIFSPEWVDWLYAVPFRSIPEGPYLNQEVGAGALAVLQHLVGAPELRAKAADYLQRKGVGWRGNFRNLDDALGYQDVWISNAYAIWRYADALDSSRAIGAEMSFEWLKLQAMRTPVPLNYGLIGPERPLDSLCIAAFAFGDQESRWLLDQHLAAMESKGETLPQDLAWLWLWNDAVPGRPLVRGSHSMTAPTGYDFRPATPAPDKLVLRSAAEPEVFALFGERSRGWHRYPATGSLIALFNGDRPVVTERIIRLKHHWLPAGRATHRDKKIDRASLSGLLIRRSGLDAWIGGITGIYSNWRQDVPAFARTADLRQIGDLQVAQIDMPAWAGIRFRRVAILNSNRWLIISDSAAGAPGLERALNWNLVGFSNTGHAGTLRQEGPGASQLDVFAGPDLRLATQPIRYDRPKAWPEAAPDTRLVVLGKRDLHVASVFQFDESQTVSGQINDKSISIDLGNAEQIVVGFGEAWKADGLTTDATVVHIGHEGIKQQLTAVDATRLTLAQPGRCAVEARSRQQGEEVWRPLAIDPPSRGEVEWRFPGPTDIELATSPCSTSIDQDL